MYLSRKGGTFKGNRFHPLPLKETYVRKINQGNIKIETTLVIISVLLFREKKNKKLSPGRELKC